MLKLHIYILAVKKMLYIYLNHEGCEVKVNFILKNSGELSINFFSTQKDTETTDYQSTTPVGILHTSLIFQNVQQMLNIIYILKKQSYL
jgi:hypothetical protein